MSDHEHDYRRGGFGVRHDATSAGEGPMPGRRTLTESLEPVQLQRAPIQRRPGAPAPAMSSLDILVFQYGADTDLKRFDDCGPACVLMALRAMRAEDAFDRRIASIRKPATMSLLEKQLELIRVIGLYAEPQTDATLAATTVPNKAMKLTEVRACLVSVLRWLGVALPDAATLFALASEVNGGDLETDTNERMSRDPTHGPAQAFIRDHCSAGSAVIVMGYAANNAWGWGGEQDTTRRVDPGTGAAQKIDDDGAHFVFVWRPDRREDRYDVLDPAWHLPREGKLLTDVMTFIYNRSAKAGNATTINIMAVPFEQIAPRIPRDATPQAKLGATTGTAQVEDGPGRPLPRLTLRKFESYFASDFSSVRVHEGGQAPSLGALAYAHGEELHFAPGQYRPGTNDGDRLLGHELAHVIQQRDGRVAVSQQAGVVVEDTALEAEADRHGELASDHQAVAARTSGAVARTGGGVQRAVDQRVVVEQLDAITSSAHACAARIAPTGALGATPPTVDTVKIRNDMVADTKRIHELSAPSQDPAVQAATARANDAVVGVYQALAVCGADDIARTWAKTGSADDKAKLVTGFQGDALGGGSDPWCGELVHAGYASAGLVADSRSIFNDADNVADFFTYNATYDVDNHRVANWILPAGETSWLPVRAYHQQRGSLRRVVRADEVIAVQQAHHLDLLLRPGDVATVVLWGAHPGHADHVVMVRRAFPNGFESIEGNNIVTDAEGVVEPNRAVGTNQWDPAGDGKGTFRAQGGTQAARIFVVGRPSVVDFEAGHRYSFGPPGVRPRP